MTSFRVVQQIPNRVYFDGQVAGDHSVDPAVEVAMKIEWKAVSVLACGDDAQSIKDFRVTPCEVAQLFEFDRGSSEVLKVYGIRTSRVPAARTQ